jgi:hypothetical protein
MAILNNAMQALVDNLHNSMSNSDPLKRLDVVDQCLVVSAIKQLSALTSWDQALGAVAQVHLDASEQILNQTQQSVTTALTTAQGDVEQARDMVQQQNASLALLPELGDKAQNAIATLTEAKREVLEAHLAATVRPVVSLKSIEQQNLSTVPGSWRSDAVLAVYDASGESWLTRPSASNSNDDVEAEIYRQEFVKIAADGSGQSVIASHYVRESAFIPNPTTSSSHYGCSAMLPLGTTIDHNDIEYEVVYSSQKDAGDTQASYGGIYCRSTGYSTLTKPKYNFYAQDQWTVPSLTNHLWYYAAVLYDNIKHCLVMVDDASSVLVEKYRDGNIITTTVIEDNVALQAYVDAGDFTTVKFITNQLDWPYGNRRFNGEVNNLGSAWMLDHYGYFGILGSYPNVRMGANGSNAHYRFTADKKLEPVNYFFTSSTNHHKMPSAEGTDSASGDLRVAMVDMQGKTLGVYHYQTKADYPGVNIGYLATALMCMNPYSQIGVLNGREYIDTSQQRYYGISRTCKAF